MGKAGLANSEKIEEKTVGLRAEATIACFLFAIAALVRCFNS
jgi:hypothetical protein